MVAVDCGFAGLSQHCLLSCLSTREQNKTCLDFRGLAIFTRNILSTDIYALTSSSSKLSEDPTLKMSIHLTWVAFELLYHKNNESSRKHTMFLIWSEASWRSVMKDKRVVHSFQGKAETIKPNELLIKSSSSFLINNLEVVRPLTGLNSSSSWSE